MIDTAAATARLIRLLSIPGITGEEALINKEIQTMLKELGVAGKAMHIDDVHKQIPLPTQTGNLIVKLPGTKKGADPILFMTHMDTVPLCAGAKPRVVGSKVVNEANTALGGDDRTGCAVLLTLVAELMKRKLEHPPITLLFTVREESGLFGARYLNPADLGKPTMGFNFDARNAHEAVIGAIGAYRWEAHIHGKASHAGVAPEKGISSTMIFSLAMAEVHAGGWFGKVSKSGKLGTSNVGVVGDAKGRSAGDATNVVTDYILVKGECRSHDSKFAKEITEAYKKAFQNAVKKVPDVAGKMGKVKFESRLDYTSFKISETSPVVERTKAAIESMGLTPNCRVTNGGLDANWMNKHGVPTVTLGAGQNEIHTVKEWVDLKEFHKGCELAVAIATM